jgi:hypothetical protein
MRNFLSALVFGVLLCVEVSTSPVSRFVTVTDLPGFGSSQRITS